MNINQPTTKLDYFNGKHILPKNTFRISASSLNTKVLLGIRDVISGWYV